MRTSRYVSVVVVLASVLVSLPVSAQVSVIPRIGTPGVGADVAVRVHPWVALRGGGAFVPVEPRFTISDIDWKLEMPTTGVLAVDLHFGGTPLRVSSGAFFLAEDLRISGEFTGSVEVGDETWTSEEVGVLRGSAIYRDWSPFLSVGYGHAAAEGVGIFVELGVVSLGSPGVELTSEGGTESNNEQFQAALEREEAQIEEDLSDADIYPVLNVGVRIGFR